MADNSFVAVAGLTAIALLLGSLLYMPSWPCFTCFLLVVIILRIERLRDVINSRR